ncbi:mycothiol system anti-sigma-R factor [Nocardiopsis sp. CNR-923]|uniref:mycothiol system anti-sigma-R factor n=1 Tax=Nocardiopsis sp. CNR-923 TaxID=1904965 RepID=UPI00095A61AE|nr:mycothiol system anti-sigma-R factor [Nocardiopsis sp. CNR-923]OLT28170.1 mycothiol system anti-sigma-R factor [Nocardiopsis sp. CNR-923]
MSGGHGEDSETPCSEVLDKLYTYIDGELEEDNCEQIREHLDDCVPCLDEYGLEEAVKKLVAKHCGCDPVPLDLRDKVLGRLARAREESLAREVNAREENADAEDLVREARSE